MLKKGNLIDFEKWIEIHFNDDFGSRASKSSFPGSDGKFRGKHTNTSAICSTVAALPFYHKLSGGPLHFKASGKTISVLCVMGDGNRHKLHT